MWRGRMPVGKAVSKASFTSASIQDRHGAAIVQPDAHTGDELPVGAGDTNNNKAAMGMGVQRPPAQAVTEDHQESILDFDPELFVGDTAYNANYCLRCIDSLSAAAAAVATRNRTPREEEAPAAAALAADTARPSLTDQLEGLLLGGLLGSAVSESLQAVTRRAALLSLRHEEQPKPQQQQHPMASNGDSDANVCSGNGLESWARDLALQGQRHAALVLQLNGLQVCVCVCLCVCSKWCVWLYWNVCRVL